MNTIKQVLTVCTMALVLGFGFVQANVASTPTVKNTTTVTSVGTSINNELRWSTCGYSMGGYDTGYDHAVARAHEHCELYYGGCATNIKKVMQFIDPQGYYRVCIEFSCSCVINTEVLE